MVSALLVPLHAASWLMSILAALGAAPSSFTVPLTLATVAGSMGVAAGAGWASAAGAAAGCSSFLLQPASIPNPKQSRPSIAIHVFLFIITPFRKDLRCHVWSCGDDRRRPSKSSASPTVLLSHYGTEYS